MASSSGRFKSSRKRVVVFVAIAVDPYHNSFHHSSLSLSPRSVNSSTFFAAHAVADERQAIFSCPCCRGNISDQTSALKAADEALELFKFYHLDVAEGMEKLDW